MQNIDTLSKYGQSFQTKVISTLIADSRILDTLSEIIHPKFFEAESNKWIVDEIINYYYEFKKPPTLDVFKSEISKLGWLTFKTSLLSVSLLFA